MTAYYGDSGSGGSVYTGRTGDGRGRTSIDPRTWPTWAKVGAGAAVVGGIALVVYFATRK